MNADKSTGKGSLKVRFQVTNQSPELKAQSSASKASTLKAGSKAGASLLKSSPPQKLSQSYVDDFDAGPRALKAGRPRTQENSISGTSIQVTDANEDLEQGLLHSKKG